MIARIYKTCGRCGNEQREESWIVDDGHGYGVCYDCADELQFKRAMKQLALKAVRCATCGQIKPINKYQPENHKVIAMATIRHSFTGYWEYHGKVQCQSCELLENQKLVAIEAEQFLKTRAIMSLVSGTKLRRKNLPEQLIQTKITQLKVSNLWQNPKI
jgi:uncharacterized Zn finger protein